MFVSTHLNRTRNVNNTKNALSNRRLRELLIYNQTPILAMPLLILSGKCGEKNNKRLNNEKLIILQILLVNNEFDSKNEISDCMPPWHFKNASLPLLKPFRNVDGLSNKYVDNLADYAPRPHCITNSEECKSEFLWCDTLAVEAHCVSKIKLHGNCTGFEWSKEACYEGRCVDGKCQLESELPKVIHNSEPSEFVDSKAMQRLRQKTMDFYKQKPIKSLQMEIINVKELSKEEKISRFM